MVKSVIDTTLKGCKYYIQPFKVVLAKYKYLRFYRHFLVFIDMEAPSTILLK